ncbi:serine/threonine-protein kinase [Actinomyces sp. 432]|uniref:serine/threonine-protein kinase n=1 Tax=Actinomyces sp. 432 TaxID=2057798 RepID=UPI001F3C2714|nr:lipopolysaccharide kinase InaA family protein [Actinomyces sp. 432]
MGTRQHRGRRRPEHRGDAAHALPPELLDALTGAGLAVGAPMGSDTPGRRAPRRGLDADGRDVVIHLLDLPDDAGGARTLRRLNEMRTLVHPGIAPVRDVIFLPGDRAAVTVDLVTGADLAVVLGARGGLTRAEAARVLDDVGSALAHLHAHGVAHGDVSPANIMVTTEGGLVLVDLFGGVLETGTDGCAAPERRSGGPATPASDVYALAALLRECSSGSAALQTRLARILADALDPDPQSRPSARALAARAHEIARPGRLVLPDGARLAAGALRAAAARPTRVVASRRLRPRRRSRVAAVARLAGACLVGLLGAIAAAGLLGVGPAAHVVPPSDVQASASAQPVQSEQSAQTGDESLTDVVVNLTARRDAALNAADPAALAETTVPGSPAAEADTATLEALAAAGESVADLDTSVLSVVEVELPADCALTWDGARAVQIRQSQSPSTRMTADGAVRTVPAQAARAVVLVLVPGPWRVAEVRAA